MRNTLNYILTKDISFSAKKIYDFKFNCVGVTISLKKGKLSVIDDFYFSNNEIDVLQALENFIDNVMIVMNTNIFSEWKHDFTNKKDAIDQYNHIKYASVVLEAMLGKKSDIEMLKKNIEQDEIDFHNCYLT